MSGTRSDLAAAKMGDLLLQGYRMLDASCPHCGTVLMQNRSGENICVLCVDTGGDDIQGMNHKNRQNSSESQRMVSGVKLEENGVNPPHPGVEQVINDIIYAMEASSGQLRSQINLDGKQRVLEFIKLCTDCIYNLKQIQNK